MRTPVATLALATACLLAPATQAQPATTSSAPRSGQTAAELGRLLDTQAAAWNRGDLDAFCAVYAGDATFVTPKGLTQGRQVILERYRTSYPDRAAMGTLSFEVVEVRDAPSAGAASMVARWTLSYPGKEAKSGLTLLVFHRVGKSWQVVQDASM